MGRLRETIRDRVPQRVRKRRANAWAGLYAGFVGAPDDEGTEERD